MLGGLLLLGLIVGAVLLKKRGVSSGGQLAWFVAAAGIVCVIVATFGILVWGFSGFG